MISVEEAQAQVCCCALPLTPKRVHLHNALGLWLVETIISDTDSPPFDKSMLDGYAISLSDASETRKVIGEVIAGGVPHRAVEPGTTIRIMTGAPVPDGTDAVVKQEETQQIDESTIRLPATSFAKGAGILRIGSSFRKGQELLAPQRRLRPVDIALLAELGKARVEVVPRPKVSVLATGNELVECGWRTTPGQIHNSNSPMLSALLTELGATPIDLGIARDDKQVLDSKMRAGLETDVLLVTGGVSVGMMDLVPSALSSLGVKEVFHKVRVKPGKPVWFGVREEGERRTLVFGLPGNPVSSLVGFELFVKPALRALAGEGFTVSKPQKGILSNTASHRGDRPTYNPCQVIYDAQRGNLPQVDCQPWRGSADLAALTRANALAILPPGDYKLESGSEVGFVRL